MYIHVACEFGHGVSTVTKLCLDCVSTVVQLCLNCGSTGSQLCLYCISTVYLLYLYLTLLMSWMPFLMS